VIPRLPNGFEIRRATREDIETAAEIVRAEEEALRGGSGFEAADMTDFWRYINPQGSWIVRSDDRTAAFSAVVERDGNTNCWAAVHPDFAARGLATALLQAVEARAGETGNRHVKVGAFAENVAAHQLFERLGYREARHYFQMRIDLDREPDAPEWPAGITQSAFRRHDARAFHSAMHDSFVEEWGFMPVPFEEWQRTRLESPDTDVSLWFVAREGDEIAAVARCSRQDGGGWIGAIGVRKPWRKRGIGLALLRHAFGEFYRRGEPHVGLGVDAQNPTGATRLYERAGMRVVKEDVVYEKELA
jgi:ribosomal protein S18 acetylase RimI-like enzyme